MIIITVFLCTLTWFSVKKILSLLLWIEDHLDRKLNTADIAQVAGCSERHLYSLFYQITGKSLADYIRCRKLTLAAYMLRCSGRQITEIAIMYGFGTLQAFSRAFRCYFGFSPREYRHASQWDMKFYTPSALLTSPLPFSFSIEYISNAAIHCEKRDVTRVAFGFNFLLLTENNRITTVNELYDHYIKIFFGESSLTSVLTVSGEMVTRTSNCDAEIHIITGHLRYNEPVTKDAISVPAGHYACFTSEGSYQDIMRFMAWTGGHGLHQYQCVLKRGPTFTSFSPGRLPKTCQVRHYFPVVNEDISFHAFLKRPGLLAV